MGKKYTAIIRKGKFEYVGICLELNISARGEDLVSVEKNLRSAIETYLSDIKEHPETVVQAISIEELIEFLKDTEPEAYQTSKESFILQPIEVHEVPSYA